jgi:hypothetical protein
VEWQLSPADQVEARLRDLEAMVFGVRGEDGLADQLGGLRNDFKEWRREDRDRRELAARAMVIALGSAVVGLLAVIVTLIGMVVTQ